MPGRRRIPGTDAQRAAVRRQQVRQNVQAHRQRVRERKLSESGPESPNFPSNYRFSRTSSNRTEPYWEFFSLHTSSLKIDVIVKAAENGTVFSLKLPFKLCLGLDSLEASACSSLEEPLDDVFFSTLMMEPDLGSTSHSSLDSSLHLVQIEPEQFQPTQLEIRCGGLNTKINFSSSSESYMLEEALIALALNMLGREISDQKLQMHAMSIENHSLGLFKMGLEDFAHKIYREPFQVLISTAMTMAMSEILNDSSDERFKIHLKGVVALIEHTKSSRSPLEILQEYREVQFPFSTIERNVSNSNSEE